ncbi:cyclic GMP-AMP synthase-like receptor 1 [Acropora palmata]|uniref:cyclic GMP-AMP synthase-like receptor 1 n=1 Tax=Acropora palmata TaxID=6131 RepID=UPI003DA0BEA8
MSEPPTGFTRVMMGNSRGMLSASRVKSVFANLVRRAIRELKCEGFVEASSHGPAVKLLITNYSDGKSYSIDLVPAIKDKTWPEDANEWISRQRGWPKQDLVDEIWQDGCHLVAKFPRGITVPEHEKEFLWRYSFSGAEKKLFLKGGQGEAGSCSKQVLRILKALKDELQLHPLTSYHLKTIFFYECEQNPHHNWSFNCLGERFMDLLQRLQDCLSIRSCPHYFISKLNLFETFSEQRCRELTGKIQLIQIDPCRALSHLMK